GLEPALVRAQRKVDPVPPFKLKEVRDHFSHQGPPPATIGQDLRQLGKRRVNTGTGKLESNGRQNPRASRPGDVKGRDRLQLASDANSYQAKVSLGDEALQPQRHPIWMRERVSRLDSLVERPPLGQQIGEVVMRLEVPNDERAATARLGL